MAGARRQVAMRKLGFPESPVVAIVELVEVLLQLRGRHSVKGAEHKALEVRDGGVHLGKPSVHLFGGRGARLDHQSVLEFHHAVRPARRLARGRIADTQSPRASEYSPRLPGMRAPIRCACPFLIAGLLTRFHLVLLYCSNHI